MYQIVRKEALNPTVMRMDIYAPLIAKKAKAGQFIILRADERGERIPLTVAGCDREAGLVTIIFQIVGGATMTLATLPQGGCVADFVGPLGTPTHIEGLKKVAVVGGGDTACEEATYLSTICSKVYMIVRRDVLRASTAMQERVMNTPNIEILWNCNTQEVLGDGSGVTGVRLLRKDGEVFDVAIDGFFLAIGHHPNSEMFSRWVNVNEEGYIITEDKTSRTNVDGVFAAGDVQDPLYRQAITAAASGCRAALDAEKFLISQKLI